MIKFLARKLTIIMDTDGLEDAQEIYRKVFRLRRNKKYKKGVDSILRQEEDTERIIVDIPEK